MQRALIMPVGVRVLDQDWYPLGSEFSVLSLTISTNQITLIHTKPFRGHLAMLLEIPQQGPTQLIADVIYCFPVGPYFQITAKFIGRV